MTNQKPSPHFREWFRKWDTLTDEAKEFYINASVDILDICNELSKNRDELVGKEKFGLREKDRDYLKSKIQEFEDKPKK